MSRPRNFNPSSVQREAERQARAEHPALGPVALAVGLGLIDGAAARWAPGGAGRFVGGAISKIVMGHAEASTQERLEVQKFVMNKSADDLRQFWDVLLTGVENVIQDLRDTMDREGQVSAPTMLHGEFQAQQDARYETHIGSTAVTSPRPTRSTWDKALGRNKPEPRIGSPFAVRHTDDADLEVAARQEAKRKAQPGKKVASSVGHAVVRAAQEMSYDPMFLAVTKGAGYVVGPTLGVADGVVTAVEGIRDNRAAATELHVAGARLESAQVNLADLFIAVLHKLDETSNDFIDTLGRTTTYQQRNPSITIARAPETLEAMRKAVHDRGEATDEQQPTKKPATPGDDLLEYGVLAGRTLMDIMQPTVAGVQQGGAGGVIQSVGDALTGIVDGTAHFDPGTLLDPLDHQTLLAEGGAEAVLEAIGGGLRFVPLGTIFNACYAAGSSLWDGYRDYHEGVQESGDRKKITGKVVLNTHTAMTRMVNMLGDLDLIKAGLGDDRMAFNHDEPGVTEINNPDEGSRLGHPLAGFRERNPGLDQLRERGDLIDPGEVKKPGPKPQPQIQAVSDQIANIPATADPESGAAQVDHSKKQEKLKNTAPKPPSPEIT